MTTGHLEAGSRSRRLLLLQSIRESETPTTWGRIQKSRRSYATRNQQFDPEITLRIRQFDPEITLWRLNFKLARRLPRQDRASRGKIATFAPLREPGLSESSFSQERKDANVSKILFGTEHDDERA